MELDKKILFIAAVHGDEPIGMEAIKQIQKIKLKKEFDSIIANPKALAQNKRFIDSDLNRIFPGNINGDYEEKRAKEIIKIAKNYSSVIDLHGTISNTGIFIIMPKFTLANLFLALSFNIKKIVIWQKSSETIGSLSYFMNSGIEIESGLRDDPKIKNQLNKILIKFLENQDKIIDFKKEIKKREIYFVFGKLTNKDKKPKIFKNWIKADNYYPIFIGQYENILCYKLKRINLLDENIDFNI